MDTKNLDTTYVDTMETTYVHTKNLLPGAARMGKGVGPIATKAV